MRYRWCVWVDNATTLTRCCFRLAQLCWHRGLGMGTCLGSLCKLKRIFNAKVPSIMLDNVDVTVVRRMLAQSNFGQDLLNLLPGESVEMSLVDRPIFHAIYIQPCFEHHRQHQHQPCAFRHHRAWIEEKLSKWPMPIKKRVFNSAPVPLTFTGCGCRLSFGIEFRKVGLVDLLSRSMVVHVQRLPTDSPMIRFRRDTATISTRFIPIQISGCEWFVFKHLKINSEEQKNKRWK